ncbi:hypothetical protein AXF42_Ash015483 [Apostasia shenzhenica]|uniref:Uncharacterized protein n=1 Tax=Apostasia shenzhenica TaxID=1088818 RepID=A0A2H9ZSC9_9ASPA|nr:hypothetical protein AXF42_Ash015483 [Apostasia shenzhenica]
MEAGATLRPKPSQRIPARRPAETVAGSHLGIYEEMETGAALRPKPSLCSHKLGRVSLFATLRSYPRGRLSLASSLCSQAYRDGVEMKRLRRTEVSPTIKSTALHPPVLFQRPLSSLATSKCRSASNLIGYITIFYDLL